MEGDTVKTCQWDGGCTGAAKPGERYCPVHRVQMLRRMERDGYLQPLPVKPERRGRSAREDVRETKFGPEQ
jgi:hypothetical protein